jgi:hypothetical protein
MSLLTWLGLPLVLLTAPSPPPEVWVFQGIEISEKVGCVNNPVVATRYTWIRKDSEYEVRRQALREELRRAHNSLASINTFQIRADKPRTIALVRKTLSCAQWNGPRKTVHSYRWHDGSDKESLLRELESDQRTSSDIQAFEVVQWIDVAGELQRLASASASACSTSLVTRLAAAEGMGQVALAQPAPAQGATISISAATDWPAALTGPAPTPVTVPGSVVIPVGSSSATFPIRVSPVLYPLSVTIAASGCGKKSTATLVLPASNVGDATPAAHLRVRAIINRFLRAGSHEKAWEDIQLIRQSNTPAGVGQDIYLAAAEHYLWAYNSVMEKPWTAPAHGVIIPVYEIIKAIANLQTTDQPTSPSTVISVMWGERGVVDALTEVLGYNPAPEARSSTLP